MRPVGMCLEVRINTRSSGRLRATSSCTSDSHVHLAHLAESHSRVNWCGKWLALTLGLCSSGTTRGSPEAKYEEQHDRPPCFFGFFLSNNLYHSELLQQLLCLCRCLCKLAPRSVANQYHTTHRLQGHSPAPIPVSDVPTLFLAAFEQEAQRFLLNRNVNVKVQRSCCLRDPECLLLHNIAAALDVPFFKSLSDLARLVAAADLVPLENAFLFLLDESSSSTLSSPGTAEHY